MKGVRRALTQRELEEAAARDDTMVMKPVYDREFEPWAVDVVEETIGRLGLLASHHASKTPAAVAQIARATGEFDDFERHYPTVFTKMCTPAFVSHPEHMSLVRAMLTARGDVARGRLSQDDANKQVANETLLSMYRLAREAERDE